MIINTTSSQGGSGDLGKISDHYVWHRTKSETVYNATKTEGASLLLSSNAGGIISEDEYYLHSSITYGTGYATSESSISLTGIFTPANPPYPAQISYWNTLLPFYVKKGTTIYEITSFTDNNGYYMCSGTTLTVGSSTLTTVDGGYVNSADPNAYPINDGWDYEFVGKLGGSAGGSSGGTTSIPGLTMNDFTLSIIDPGAGSPATTKFYAVYEE